MGCVVRAYNCRLSLDSKNMNIIFYQMNSLLYEFINDMSINAYRICIVIWIIASLLWEDSYAL